MNTTAMSRSSPLKVLSILVRTAVLGSFIAYIAQPLACRSALLDQRQIRVLSLADPSTLRSTHPKVRPYEIVAAAALAGCPNVEDSDYMAALSSIPGVPASEEPVEMFALPPLVRFLYQSGHCLSPAQRERLVSGLTVRQRLTGHGAVNHAALRATSWYLLAQYFPDVRWIDWNGRVYTSPQLMAQLKSLLLARTWRFFRSGPAMWLSPTYAMTGVFPMLNLIDFADDAAVRKAAEDETVLQLALLRLQSFHGTLVPPMTRRNYDQRNAPESPRNYIPSVAQHVLWYYFDEPYVSDYDLRSRTEPFYVAMLAQSRWKPPLWLRNLVLDGQTAYNVRVTTPTFATWGDVSRPSRDVEMEGDTLIGPDFAIGTASASFDPGWFSDHVQTFAVLLKSREAHNEISCYHPYFRSNLGEDAWSSDRWSPFQQMHRYDDTSVVMLFDIPLRDPWIAGADNRFTATRSRHKDALLQFFQCRIPRSFDETVFEGHDWIFVRHGSAYVAIATLKGRNEIASAFVPGSTAYRVFKAREPRSALFFRVEKAEGRSFEQFRAEVRKRLPAYDADRSAVAFTDQDGVATRVVFSLEHEAGAEHRLSARPKVYRNGRLQVDTRATRVVDSPYLKLEGGVLTVDTPSGSIRIDYSSPRPDAPRVN